MIDRHYGHLARDGREHAIRLLDTFNAAPAGRRPRCGRRVDARSSAPIAASTTTKTAPEQAKTRSPLTDSNRRPPPYHRKQRQWFRPDSARFRASANCHRLPPVATTGLHKGSILCSLLRQQIGVGGQRLILV